MCNFVLQLYLASHKLWHLVSLQAVVDIVTVPPSYAILIMNVSVRRLFIVVSIIYPGGVADCLLIVSIHSSAGCVRCAFGTTLRTDQSIGVSGQRPSITGRRKPAAYCSCLYNAVVLALYPCFRSGAGLALSTKSDTVYRLRKTCFYNTSNAVSV